MNEFVARNGLIALDSSSISGPFVVTGSSTFNGNVTLLGNISSPNFNGNIQAGSIFSFYSSEGVISAGSNLSINIGPASALGINKTNNITSTSGEVNWIYINPPLAKSFAPTSGTATMNGILLNLLVNQSGGANGITRGIRVVPTLTSAWDFRAIEWTNNASATSGSWGLYGAGSAPNYLSGSLSIGPATNEGLSFQYIQDNTLGGSFASRIVSLASGVAYRDLFLVSRAVLFQQQGYINSLYISPNGNTILNSLTDDGVNKLQVSGSARITNGLSVTGSITANDITVTGTLTAQTLVVQTITSSIDFVTGSTRFGSLSSDTHQFTGSVSISGSSPLLRLGSTTFVGDSTNPAITLGSTSNGIYLDSNRVFFKAGGSFAGGFSSTGLQGNQIQIRNDFFNDLTTAMYIPYRLNAIGLLGGLGGNSAGDITLITSGSSRLFVSSSGNIGIGTTSPAYQVDITGQARVQGIFYNTGYNASVQRLGFNSGIAASNLGYIIASSNGVFRLVDAAEADFTRLQFGGTTTSFPALQRTGSALSVVDATGASGTNLLVGTTADTGQRLQVSGSSKFLGDMVITGSGATSATNAFTVQNSNGASILRTRSDGAVYIEAVNTLAALYMSSNGDSIITKSTSGTNGIIVYGPASAHHTLTISSFNSDNYTNGALSSLRFPGNFISSTGNTAFSYMLLNGTINQTGTSTSITRGLYVNPTLTAAADFRAIEWSNNAATSPSQSWGLYGVGTAPNYLSGSLLIGSASNSGENLQVYGTMKVNGITTINNAVTIGTPSTGGTQLSIQGSFSTRFIIKTSSTLDGFSGTILNSAIDYQSNDLIISSKATSTTSNIFVLPSTYTYMAGNVLINNTVDDTVNRLQVSGSTRLSGNTVITGSLIVTQGISGSFSGSYVGNGSQLTGIVASAASTASYVNTLNQNVLVTGGVSASSYLYSELDITAQQNLRSVNSSGDEGGEIFLNKAVTNTTLNGGVTIDVWQNRLRFFEQGGTARGYYIDISNGGAGVSTNLVGGGGSTSPGGSNTQIQYNNGGAFGGVPVLTYDGTTLRATGSFTGSLAGSLLGTASFATSSSFAISSSFASTASFAPNYVLTSVTASMLTPYLLVSQTSSFITNAQTSSFVQNSQTSSFVQNSQTSSFVQNSQTSSMSVATASFATSSLSASFASTAASAPLYVLTSVTSSMLAPYVLNLQTSSFVTNAQTSSFVQNSQTSSFVTNTQTSSMSVLSASFASTASFAPNYVLTSVTASMLSPYVLNTNTASFITNSQTSSMTVLSSSFATTASSADNFLVRGTLTAQTIVAQTITSSTDFVTGSTRFGSLSTNTHQFTGSVSITGSLAVNGNNVVTNNQTSSFVTNTQTSSFVLNSQTSSMSVATASFATSSLSASFASTASFAPLYVLNSQTSSFVTNAQTSSFVQNSQTSSFVLNSQTSSMSVLSSSFSTTSSYSVSSSFAISASWAPGGSSTPTFPYTGSAIISGSLTVTGSIIATQGISGSFSGSYIGNGSGLTGVVASAAPAGPNTSIQFNDAGATSGSGAFTFTKSTNTVTLQGSGSTLLLITGSRGELFKVTDSGSASILATISSGSLNVLTVTTSSVDITGSVNITGSLLLNGSSVGGGSVTGQIILTAGGGWPSITSGSNVPLLTETATNKVNFYYIGFPDTIQTFANWSMPMPSDYNGGTITAVFYWVAGNASTNSVEWGLAARAFADGDALDQAFGTAQEVTDANQANDDVNISAATPAITIAGTPAGGNFVQFRAYRNPGDANDTLAATAELLSIRITYTRA